MNRLQGPRGALPAASRYLPDLSRPLWIAALVLAALAALLPGLWTGAALVVMAGVTLSVARPEVAVYLMALSVPFGSLLEIEVGTIAVTPTDGLAALLAIGWAARAMARRRLELPLTPLSVPLAAMLFVVGISAYQAAEPALTLKETVKWLELAIVYFFIVAEMRGSGPITALLAMLLLAATLEALVGGVQFGLGLGPDTFAIGPFMRAYGTFEQPNPYAGYLGMLIPLAVGLLVARPWRRGTRWVLAACLFAVAAVGMSLSRGAWVGIGLGLVVMMLFWTHRSRILLVAGAVATAPLGVLAFVNLLPAELAARLATAADYFRFVDATSEPVTSQNWAVIERVAHWQAALDMIADHPLLGVGAGNYPAAYEQYFLPGWTEALGHAHNYYLNVAAELGVPGMLVYLLIPTVALGHAMVALVRSGAGPSALSTQHSALGLWRGLLLGALGALVASSVHNLFDSLFVHSMSVQLGMILALAQVSASTLTPRSRPL